MSPPTIPAPFFRRPADAGRTLFGHQGCSPWLVGLVLLFLVPSAALAQPGNLNFFNNWFVTGGYAAAGVGVRGTGGENGSPADIATAEIHFTNSDPNGPTYVPPNADILAAFLYWQTVVNENQPETALAGATFNGNAIDAIAFQVNPAGTSPCWSSGGGTGGANGAHKTRVYRADVLRFLPVELDDSTGLPISKRLVTDEDLDDHGFQPGHVVQLPDSGSGNQTPSTAGASLVVIYRDPAKPLTSIVIYNGGFNMDNSSHGITQTLKGFYQAADPDPGHLLSAKMTHIVADGSGNNDRLRITGGSGTYTAPNVFNGADGPTSDPAWDTLTVPLDSAYIAQNDSSVTTIVDHTQTPFDCLTWGAIVFSTTVKDTDFDGLLDNWETDGLYQRITRDPVTQIVTNAQFGKCTDPAFASDPNFALNCVNLPAMGASATVQDIFVEIGYMQAEPDTTYGPLTSGSCLPPACVQDPAGHHHRPSPTILSDIAALFARSDNPARQNPANPTQTISGGIKIHFDVGTISGYSGTHIVPAAHARGGEEMIEAACEGPMCNFPDFPGTVGWKNGFQFLRDQPLSHSTETACLAAGQLCERRFDQIRFNVFRYALFAHARGIQDPEKPAGTPLSSSGVSDGGNGGGDLMVSLGMWDNFTASAFVQKATFVHELGHTLSLRHGGGPPTTTDPSPNCKPNYQSTMNYLFQIRGLECKVGQAAICSVNGPVVDFSRQKLGDPYNAGAGTLDEANFTEQVLKEGTASMSFPTRWFIPQTQLSSTSLYSVIGTSPAGRHCNGTVLHDDPSADEGDPKFPFIVADTIAKVRVESTYPIGSLDWNGNGTISPPSTLLAEQDLNFNGDVPSSLEIPANADGVFRGFNDWQHLDLRQTGDRFNMRGLSLEMTFTDMSAGDPYGGDPYGGDPYGGDPYGGDPYGGDPYGGDPYGGDPYGGDPYGGDIDFDTAVSVGNAPNNLRVASVTNQAINLAWDPANAGYAKVTEYQVWRKTGTLPWSKIFSTPAGQTPVTTYSDTSSKKNVVYQYVVVAVAHEKVSGPSNQITAVR